MNDIIATYKTAGNVVIRSGRVGRACNLINNYYDAPQSECINCVTTAPEETKGAFDTNYIKIDV